MSKLAAVVGGLAVLGAGVLAGPQAVDALTLSCASVAPGGSWEQAAADSEGGCIISVPAGTYGQQNIGPIGVKASPVVFEGNPGVSVSLKLGTLGSLGPSNLTFRDLTFSGQARVYFSNDIRFERVNAGGLNTDGVNGFSWIGGTIDMAGVSGNYVGVDNCLAGPPTCLDSRPTRNVLFDGLTFKNATVSDGAVHSQCLQINSTGGAIDGLTIRNSVFENCSDFGILLYAQNENVLLENNFIDQPMPADPAFQGSNGRTDLCNPGCVRSGFSVDLDGAGSRCTNVVYRYNTALGGMRIRGCNAQSTGLAMTANFHRDASCAMGTYRYNVSNGGATCGTGDRIVPSYWNLFVDGNPQDGTMDLHLNIENGWGDPGDFPTTDFDNDTRSSPPDAGADEIPGVTTTTTPTSTTTTPTTTMSTTTTTTTSTSTTTEPSPVDSLELHILSLTESTVTVGWTPVSGLGYRFLVDGKIVSHSWDATRSSVKFKRLAGSVLRVESLQLGPFGSLTSP